ncbi:hypothetical protein COLINT_02207 [Collinsella intestinalis DSM 13280]|uniref:Uncharacterized protein n=1 Tax=Collinsella intestinalis DSM 13280 TaxID=521003 RepID=C4F838_9ACTN|nr:hypothetical protein COLINT_02207 [Collinsella intestinalis DSM 13280]
MGCTHVNLAERRQTSLTLNTDKSFILKIAEGSHASAHEPSEH